MLWHTVKCRKESILSFLPSLVTPSDRKTGSTGHQTSRLTVAGSPSCRSLDVHCCPAVTLTVHVLSVDRMEASLACPELLGLWKLLDVWSHLSGPGYHGLTGRQLLLGSLLHLHKRQKGENTTKTRSRHRICFSLSHHWEPRHGEMGEKVMNSLSYLFCTHFAHDFFYIYKGILVCDYFIF